MRQNALAALLGLTTLAACQLPNGGMPQRTLNPLDDVGAKTIASQAKPAAAPSPAKVASATASAQGTPAASSAAVPSLGPTTAVTGLIELNPAYVIAAGGGNVIAAGGGNVIAAGGGNVIAAGGGNVIAAGGGNYRVLDATASGTAGASGTAAEELPVEGVVVTAVSLSTHDVIAKAVFSDKTGHYTLQVPDSADKNYVILAAFPGKNASDAVLANPDLRFTMVAGANDQGSLPLLDEDSSSLGYYVRNCIRPFLTHLLFDTDQSAAISNFLEDMWTSTGVASASDPASPDPISVLVRGVVESGVTKLRALLPSTGLSAQEKEDAVNAMIDVTLAKSTTPPDRMPVSPYAEADQSIASNETAAQMLEGALQFLRKAADQHPERLSSADVLAQMKDSTGAPFVDPATNKPYVLNNGQDLERFVVQVYLTGNVSQPLSHVDKLFWAICVDAAPETIVEQEYALHAATTSFLLDIYQGVAGQGGLPALPKGVVQLN